MKYYGIKVVEAPFDHRGRIGVALGFSCSQGCSDGEGEPVEFELELYADNVWLVLNKYFAEKAAVNDTEWYNAGYESPRNRFVTGKNADKYKLEVFEVEI